MKEYHIGFDFGTYQSKACVFDITNSTHEFVKFENDSFFLPSRVARDVNDLFVYGDMKEGKGLEEYRYFKIAAAEDPEFHAETFGKPSSHGSEFYQFTDIINFSAEFLSVTYITYALLYIKEKYYNPDKDSSSNSSLISRLFRRKESNEITRFTVQIGIPTEWSHIRNLRRKRKFENILMVSELLQKKYLTLSGFLSTPSNRIIEDIKNIYKSLNFTNIEEFNQKLNDLGVSVYPETAAGLTFILRTKQLLPGYYSILDVGGGTSDISFFRVMEDLTIKYLASESYLMAANNVYRQYYGECRTMSDLNKAENNVKSLIEKGIWKEDIKLYAALKDVNRQLESVIYKLFNRRVYYYNKNMVTKYCNQPIILYGGGTRLPVLNSGKIKIHDNGCESINIDHTFLEKDEIERFTSIINIKPNDKSWKNDFSLLVVALGLSYIKPESSADWFIASDYNWKDGIKPVEVPHPFNEDCYTYDVLNSQFYSV
jgi:hypothetical protein